MRTAGRRVILPTGDMTTELSAEVELPQQPLIVFQATWTGVPEGTLTLECLEEDEPSQNWQVVETVLITGAAGSEIWDIWQTAVSRWRVHYVPDTGTGTLKVTFRGSGA